MAWFSVAGAGRFPAAANGNAASLEPFHEPRMQAFQGMLVVVVQAGNQAGNIKLEVTGKCLQSAALKLTAGGAE